MSTSIKVLTRLMAIVPVICSNLVSGQGHNSIISPRLIIDLGSSPWKFKKLGAQGDNDTIAFKNITIPGDVTPQVRLIELNTSTTIGLVKYYFSDVAVASACYKIEASSDNVKWVVLSDKTIDGEQVSYQSANVVKSTGNTVGYVEAKKNAFISFPVNAQYRFIRFAITKLLNDNHAPVSAPPGTLHIYQPDTIPSSAQNYQSISANDNDWQDVGIPHCYNDMDTYLNTNKGGMWSGAVWYRKHIRYVPVFAGKKIFLEFDGVNIGAAVYINGKFKQGNSAVQQPANVTHIGGFLPFSLDITDDLIPGADNLIAVKVSNAPHDFFTWPGFGVYEGFGMGWGGIVCPVKLYVVNKVHIPLNSYSPLNNWGTYNAVITADSSVASIRLQTNVKNDDAVVRKMTLQHNIVDAKGRLVTSVSIQREVRPGKTAFFDTLLNVTGPHLWYPNNSPHGKPYLYRVNRIVKLNGIAVDEDTADLGIRTITWDSDYCYINHKKQLLRGFGNRNSYPALGSAIPKAIQWNDIRLIAEAGGNTLRVGHVPATRQTLQACDVYGVLVLDDSGDNEWMLKNEPASTYKKEYDRDMIINFRNYTSVAIWEANNGLAKNGVKYLPTKTQEVVDQWDSLQHRIVLTRDGYPADLDKNHKFIVGYTNRYAKQPGFPSINTEVYGAFWDGRRSFNIARDDYDNEKAFSKWFVDNWLRDIDKGACGWIDWMLAETQGEGYTIYMNGKSKQRSLGSCAMDGNRFPKLKYRIYQNALWVPLDSRPGVTLQSTWNLSGVQTIDAWSNCPQAELFLNGKSLGKHTPDARTKQISWPDVAFQPGKLKIVGLDAAGKIICADSLITAGKPDHIVLSVEHLTAPDGSVFPIKANGSDAAVIRATIVDKNGNWCPDAVNNIQFSVMGDADYRGSYNFYVTEGRPNSYHSPGDHELAAEGGLMKVAVRSKFKPGVITIQATSAGLTGGQTSYIITEN